MSGEADDGAKPGFAMKRPSLFLALLWHQHQPFYGDFSSSEPGDCFPVPWVRLHSLRGYCSMAALVAEFPGIHLTINLTHVLLQQIEDYVERDATDTALELTRTPTADLTADQPEAIASIPAFAIGRTQTMLYHIRRRPALAAGAGAFVVAEGATTKSKQQ